MEQCRPWPQERKYPTCAELAVEMCRSDTYARRHGLRAEGSESPACRCPWGAFYNLQRVECAALVASSPSTETGGAAQWAEHTFKSVLCPKAGRGTDNLGTHRTEGH